MADFRHKENFHRPAPPHGGNLHPCKIYIPAGAINLGVKMPALEKLNLSKNKITNLPATFLPETCNHLKLINFKQNGLKEITNDELACERNDFKYSIDSQIQTFFEISLA